jgi:hypothetical protein
MFIEVCPWFTIGLVAGADDDGASIFVNLDVVFGE